MSTKKKIRFSLPLDLLVKVYTTKKADETFDERVERLLRVGMSQAGLLPLPDDCYRFLDQIELKQGGHIRVYEGSKRGFITYDLWQGDYDLSVKGHAIISELFFCAIRNTNGAPNLEGLICPMWHSGSVRGVLNDRLEGIATDLKQILENNVYIDKIARSNRRLEKDRIRPESLEGEELD